MSVAIRLTKTGKKNSHSFRVVAITKRSKRDGKNLAVLGFYNPSQNPPTLEINKDDLKSWIEKGAEVSPAVQQLMLGKYEFKKYNPKAEKEAAKAQEQA